MSAYVTGTTALLVALQLLLAQPAAQEEPAAAAPADDAWMQEARDWLVACRVAYDKLSPEQTAKLSTRFATMSPAALRVLVTVYEQTYRVESPLSAADRRPPDATEAEREWLVAYRILYDRIEGEEAQKYARTLEAMSASQIRALVEIYRQRAQQQAQREARSPGASSSAADDPQADARRKLAEARARMEFEQQRRQLALGRASMARSQTNQALVAANASAAATAAESNQRLRDLEAFSNIQILQGNEFNQQSYLHSSPGGPYNHNYWYRLW